jgi:hypothetical protein
MTDHAAVATAPQAWHRGDRVKVLGGRYAGRLATVSRVTPGGLVEVELDSMAGAGIGIIAVRPGDLLATTRKRPRASPRPTADDPTPTTDDKEPPMGVKIPRTQAPRDSFGRPMLVPPGGGDRVPYRRTTTFVSVLDAKEGLMKWQQRQLAVGFARRPDLMLACTAVDAEAALARTSERRDDGEAAAELDGVIAKAVEPSSASAITGTALHRLCEKIDLGQTLGAVPEPHAGDIRAYTRATTGIKWVQVETFRVFDDWKVAGTADRLGWWRGRLVVADIKTGDVSYSGKIAMQIACYARSLGYDIATDTRREPDVDLDLTTGLVIHLPAGGGTCDLYEVDLEKGWEACRLAKQVWDWRAAKGLLVPVGDAVIADAPDFAAQARSAPDIDELRRTWYAARDAGALTPEVREAIEDHRQRLVPP